MTTTIDVSLLRRSTSDGVPRIPVMRADWHDDPVIALDGAVPYLVAPAARDPHRRPDGRRPIPNAQLTELRRMERTGIRFDEIAIAHELDADGAVSSLLPMLSRGPVTCSDEVARLVVGPAPEHPGVSRAVRALDLVAGGVSAVGSAARARLEARLDPIVFGVVGVGEAPRDGAPAIWFPLVAWRW